MYCIFYNFVSALPTPPRAPSPLDQPTFMFFLSFNIPHKTQSRQAKHQENKNTKPNQKPTKTRIYFCVGEFLLSAGLDLEFDSQAQCTPFHLSQQVSVTNRGGTLCPLLLSVGSLCGLNLWRPCAYCHSLCECVCASLLCVWKTLTFTSQQFMLVQTWDTPCRRVEKLSYLFPFSKWTCLLPTVQ